jgi:hypothetical protein
MPGKRLVVAIVAAASLGALFAGCGSTTKRSAGATSQASALGGPAPERLVGTFKTSLSRRDAARAPKPNELPIGPWTLVIGNSGGPNNSRALGMGNGDTNRVVYRFGVKGNVLSVGCNDDLGLPAAGSQSYSWSIHERALTLNRASGACQGGDRNAQVILTSHPWTKQGP